MPKSSSSTEKVKVLLQQIDTLAFWVSLAGCVLLYLAYSSLWNWAPEIEVHKQLKDFSLAIIPNIIAAWLLFLLSYAFLRRIQLIKAENNEEELVNTIVSTLLSNLNNKLTALFQNDLKTVKNRVELLPDSTIVDRLRILSDDNFKDIKNRLELLERTAAFAGRKEELIDLVRIQNNLRNLDDNVTHHTQIISTTVKDEFLSLSQKFRNLEQELRDITLKDVRKTLERELQALQIGLNTQEINRLSATIAESVERTIEQVEKNRMGSIEKEIDSGFSAISGKVNQTVVELKYQQKEMSKNIIEKIDNHADVITFVSEIREQRQDLINLMWGNIQNEFIGEIKQGLPVPQEMITDKLTKDLDLDINQANELASDLTKTFLLFLSTSLNRMQSEKIDPKPKSTSRKKVAKK